MKILLANPLKRIKLHPLFMPQKWSKLHVIAVVIAICLMAVIEFIPQDYFMYFVVGAIVVIGIAGGIAKSFIQRNTGEGTEISPLAQKIRQYQDTQQNAGWRIEMISFDDPFKPMTIQTNGVAALGAIAFIAGFVLLIYNPVKFKAIGLRIAVGGFLLALLSIWFRARRARKDWQVVSAKCVDCELRKLPIIVNGHYGWGWFWRIICEYNYSGKEVRVTPVVSRINFTSEEAAMKFLDENISPDGGCRLHINPKNLLQTELVHRGIEEKLLYRRS